MTLVTKYQNGIRGVSERRPKTNKGAAQPSIARSEHRAEKISSKEGVVHQRTNVLGGLGGYALRRAPVATSQAAAANDDGRTSVVPRSLREDSGITPFQAPAPRWTHEDDVIGSATK